MRCFKDYIGLQGCGTIIPESGLYVNSQPGITTESIANSASSEKENYLSVWDDIQERSVLKFNTLVLARMKKKFKVKSILETIDIGKNIDTSTTFSAESKWKGFTVGLNTVNPESIAQISVQQLVLYLLETSTTTVKIIDINTEEVLFTKSVTGNAGWNTIAVGKSFISQGLIIAYDANTVEQTSMPIPNYNNHTGCCVDCGCNCELVFKGATTSSLDTPIDITYGNDFFGLSAVISLVCSFEKLVCSNKIQFANAWMNILCAEIMFEAMFSDRVNRWTTIDRKKAEELRSEFELTAVGELDNITEGIELNDKCCLQCRDLITYAESQM